MIKRIGIAGTALVAMLILSSFAAASASAQFSCYEVSGFKRTVKGGNWSVATCTGSGNEVVRLTGKWVLAEPLYKTAEGVWCAALRLGVAEVERNTGYYQDPGGADKCEAKLEKAEENSSNLTEVNVLETPNVLPEATGALPVTSKSSSGKSTFGNGLLELTSSTSKGTQTGNTLKSGSFKIELEGTKSIIGSVCTGLSDTGKAGLVLVAGTFHIRDYKEGASLKTAEILLLEPVHFECEGGILLVILGCVAGALTPENVLTKTLTARLAKNGSKNDNVIITVLKETNEGEEACQLLASENSGAFKLSNMVTTQTLTGFAQNGVTNIEVLVMPL
jgi:hypothetical protein